MVSRLIQPFGSVLLAITSFAPWWIPRRLSISETGVESGGLGRFALTSSEVTVSSGSLLLGAGFIGSLIQIFVWDFFASLPSTAVHSEGRFEPFGLVHILVARHQSHATMVSSVSWNHSLKERCIGPRVGFGIAPMLRFGIAYEKPRWFLLAADVVYYGAIDYALLRDSQAQNVPENFVPFSN